jgi:hypothetical protein
MTESGPAFTFTIYASGICYMSVCTTLPRPQVEERANVENPSGVSPWRIHDGNFNDGHPNPTPCSDHPETHQHYLLSC